MRQDSRVREVDMSSDFSGGPGFLAFVATFGLVIAGVILFLSLSRHLRKVRAQEAKEAAAQADVQATPASSPAPSGDGEGGEGRGDEVTDESSDRQ